MLLLCPAAARAQVSASITATTDDRFRGRSVSRGDPAVIVNLSYDHRSGVYAGASAASAVVDGAPRVVNVQTNIGYVHRTAGGTGLELGVVRSDYSKYASGGRGANYTEAYAGVMTRRLALHVHYSPHYFRPGAHTVYVGVDGVVEPAPDWRLTAHAGGLLRVAGPIDGGASRFGYDWRIGAARNLGPIELQLALSDGGPNDERYDDRDHDRLAVTLSLVWSL